MPLSPSAVSHALVIISTGGHAPVIISCAPCPCHHQLCPMLLSSSGMPLSSLAVSHAPVTISCVPFPCLYQLCPMPQSPSAVSHALVIISTGGACPCLYQLCPMPLSPSAVFHAPVTISCVPCPCHHQLCPMPLSPSAVSHALVIISTGGGGVGGACPCHHQLYSMPLVFFLTMQMLGESKEKDTCDWTLLHGKN